eukprot:Skav219116  [mRNA]  locus=scaffold1574:379950:381544:- [translate_table: standard]
MEGTMEPSTAASASPPLLELDQLGLVRPPLALDAQLMREPHDDECSWVCADVMGIGAPPSEPESAGAGPGATAGCLQPMDLPSPAAFGFADELLQQLMSLLMAAMFLGAW